MSKPAPFSETWSLEDTKLRLNETPFPREGSAAEQHQWRLNTGEPFHKKLSTHIGRHIAWMMQQGVQVVPKFCEHTSVWSIHELKKLQENPESQSAQQAAGSHFSRAMDVYVCFEKPINGDPIDPAKAHNRLLSVIEDGEFDLIASTSEACALSGAIIDVEFKGWAGVAGITTRTPIPNSWRTESEFIPLVEGQIKVPSADTVPLPMPTGELLIADWFRIPAFNALTKDIDDAPDSDHNINTVAGRAIRTRRYANELGVGHVGVRSPSILQDEGVIKAGFLDPNLKEPESCKGTLCADLRWTTLVDKGHLIELLSSKLGQEEAIAQVETYLRETDDIIRVQVQPGMHHLYFAGAAQLFAETISQVFQADGLYLEEFQEPAFALTQAPLQPSLQDEVKQEHATSLARKSVRPT